ncbi:hypothetical protein DUI87_03116 [Hirundo rustica rustica]|uniref:Uncharacterized protein n=1 Tax=Hirundo rustica rustica TaxID=333673 RepID=A0A3M0L266_HIRRU|nr:hypothetical protein DUI87_03116 [Hirundo rustica rustica]
MDNNDGNLLGPVTTAFENLEFPLDVKESMFLLLSLPGLLSVVHTMFRVEKEIFRKVIQRSAPRETSHVWHGMREKMGQVLEKFSPPMFSEFTPEQRQDPDKVIEYSKGKYCGGYREE